MSPFLGVFAALPPKYSVLAVVVPIVKLAPFETVKSPHTRRFTAAVPYAKMPLLPCPTVRLLHTAAAVIVTVAPSAITTS